MSDLEESKGSTAEQRSELFGPLPNEARFNAYYYSFEPTRVGPVDAVLSAVAWAGKGSHHTESWDADGAFGYYKNLPGLVDGRSAIDLIQKNADQAADLVLALLEDVRVRDERIAAALKELDAVADHSTQAERRVYAILTGGDPDGE